MQTQSEVARVGYAAARSHTNWSRGSMLQSIAACGCAIAKGKVLLMLLNAPPWSKGSVLHSIAACGLYEQEAEGRVFGVP